MTEITRRTRVALVLDPRFSGGTSSAVAREIRALAPLVDLRLVALETRMFKGRTVNPALQSAADDLGLAFDWNPRAVRAEIVVFHNPSCLKFDARLPTRIICDQIFVVTHENFLRPNGSEGFDVALCLEQIAAGSIAAGRWLAPVSGYNRRGVETWHAADLGQNRGRLARAWKIADFDWFNICDFETRAATSAPADRRGRMSRAGFEKFPSLALMEAHFPEHAAHCAILGGDSFLLDPEKIPEHWHVHPFGALPVTDFLTEIDFFIYFTHPQWRESFGRVIAEAIAAGKVVITDAGTAEIFGDAVIAVDPAAVDPETGETEVDTAIASLIAEPSLYADFVSRAQSRLARFGTEAFRCQILDGIARAGNRARTTPLLDLASAKDTAHAAL